MQLLLLVEQKEKEDTRKKNVQTKSMNKHIIVNVDAISIASYSCFYLCKVNCTTIF